MKEYEKLQKEIKEFLDNYLSNKKIIASPNIINNKITAETLIDYAVVDIYIIIGEFMSDIILEAYLGCISELCENQSISIHLYNIPNEDMQSDNIINAFKQIYPKFEKLIKFNNVILEVIYDV